MLHIAKYVFDEGKFQRWRDGFNSDSNLKKKSKMMKNVPLNWANGELQQHN